MAGCFVPSHCAVSASRPLSLRHRLSLTCQLVVALPLVAPPPPCVSFPTTTASRNAPAGCRIASNNAALLFARMRDDPQYGGSGAQEWANRRCQGAIAASLLCAVAIAIVAQAGCCQWRQGAIVVHAGKWDCRQCQGALSSSRERGATDSTEALSYRLLPLSLSRKGRMTANAKVPPPVPAAVASLIRGSSRRHLWHQRHRCWHHCHGRGCLMPGGQCSTIRRPRCLR
jgi:hypothetical protein